jgi:hypothetical protein
MVESFLCDVCGKEGERYTVQYPDGTLVLDRCDKHNRKLMSLRDEQGTWNRPEVARNSFRLATPDDIKAARARHGSNGNGTAKS